MDFNSSIASLFAYFLIVIFLIAVIVILLITARYFLGTYLMGVTDLGKMSIRPKAVKEVVLNITSQFHEITKVKSTLTHSRQGLMLNVSLTLNQVVDENYLHELQTEIHNVLQGMGVKVYSVNVSVSSINQKKIR